MKEEIFVKGAKENNLKNIDVHIPRNKLVVFTGLSGSGKSTLAFDTIFAEGQRRYVESLSSYARQFLGQMEKPDVESIDGLYDYMRLLFARIGVPHCPKCGREIRRQTVDEIADQVMAMPEGSKILVNAPVVRGRKGEYTKNLEAFRKSGYARVKVDGIVYDLQEDIKLDKNIKHNISVVVDRLVVKDGIQKRLSDSLENALKLADGLVVIDCEGAENLYSIKYSCPDCGISIEEIEPRLFSFNTPYGACPECAGLGFKQVVDEALICPDKNKTLREGAIQIGGWYVESKKTNEMYAEAVARHYGIDMDVPVKDLPKKQYDILMYGNGNEQIDMKYDAYNFHGTYKMKWEGFVNTLTRRYKNTESEGVKAEIERYITQLPCPECGGKRLKKEALSVYVGGKNIAQLCDMSIDDLYGFFDALTLSKTEHLIADLILKEIKARLNFLRNVGLSYLNLARSAGTLSGGESQRIRLATQIGSGLTGVLYILDEPSI